MRYVLLAFGLSVLLTCGVRRAAYRLRWVAAPREDRWHYQPVALMWGAGIFLAYLAAFLWFAPQEKGFWVITPTFQRKLAFACTCMTHSGI